MYSVFSTGFVGLRHGLLHLPACFATTSFSRLSSSRRPAGSGESRIYSYASVDLKLLHKQRLSIPLTLSTNSPGTFEKYPDVL